MSMHISIYIYLHIYIYEFTTHGCPQTQTAARTGTMFPLFCAMYISIKPRPAHQLSHPLSRDYHASTFPVFV